MFEVTQDFLTVFNLVWLRLFSNIVLRIPSLVHGSTILKSLFSNQSRSDPTVSEKRFRYSSSEFLSSSWTESRKSFPRETCGKVEKVDISVNLDVRRIISVDFSIVEFEFHRIPSVRLLKLRRSNVELFRRVVGPTFRRRFERAARS